MFTRKDYVAFALILSDARDLAFMEARSEKSRDAVLATVFRIENDLCALFRADNPRFDETRFRRAAAGTGR